MFTWQACIHHIEQFVTTHLLYTVVYKKLLYKQPSTQKRLKVPSPRQWRIGRRLSPFLVTIGHTTTDAVKATARGGWPTGSSVWLTFPLHSLMSSTRREGNEYHF